MDYKSINQQRYILATVIIEVIIQAFLHRVKL